MKRLTICSVVCTLILFSACGPSTVAPGDAGSHESSPISCMPRAASLDLGWVLVERASELPRRERRSACAFVENLCIDLEVSNSPCGGNQIVCLAWEGRDADRSCDVIRLSADASRADLMQVYQWFADLVLGK